MIVNVYGPSASGKTRNAQLLKALYGCTRIRDDEGFDFEKARWRKQYFLENPLADGDLVLTQEPLPHDVNVSGVLVAFIKIEDALERLAEGGAA